MGSPSVRFGFFAWIMITLSIFLPWCLLGSSWGSVWVYIIRFPLIMSLVLFSSITGFLALKSPHDGAQSEKAGVNLSLASGFTALAAAYVLLILHVIPSLGRLAGGTSPTFGPCLVLVGALMWFMHARMHEDTLGGRRVLGLRLPTSKTYLFLYLIIGLFVLGFIYAWPFFVFTLFVGLLCIRAGESFGRDPA